MPELTAGATVHLEFPAATGSGRGQEARVLALAGRTLDPPLTVQVRPAPDPFPDAPARLAGTTAAPPPEASSPEPGPRPDPVRVFAAVLGQGGAERTPRMPPPDAGLAARLLQLIRLIDGTSADVAADEALPDDLPAEQRTALASALADLRAVAREPAPGLWRLLLLPFGVPGEVGDLRLYLRDDPARQGSGQGQAGSDDDAPPRRAIFEFDFSRLGRCQLDVFCQGRRFDLVLRSQKPLGPELRRGIEALFVTARDAGGLVGELGFARTSC